MASSVALPNKRFCRLCLLKGFGQRQQWLRNYYTVAASYCVMMPCARFNGPQLKRKAVDRTTPESKCRHTPKIKFTVIFEVQSRSHVTTPSH